MVIFLEHLDNSVVQCVDLGLWSLNDDSFFLVQFFVRVALINLGQFFDIPQDAIASRVHCGWYIMGTIIRITGDGVFIESGQMDGSVEPSLDSTDSFNHKMCSLSHNVVDIEVIDAKKNRMHTIDCTDSVEQQVTQINSSEMNFGGQRVGELNICESFRKSL